MAESIMREHMHERFGKVFHYTENPPLPQCLNIELNNNCNQTCIFCDIHGKYAPHPPKPAMMSLKWIKKILDEAKRLDMGRKELGFYLGGEVFLHKDLPEVIGYARKNGFPYIFITTNGALADEDKIKAVVDAGLDSIRFSINAADKETYAEIHGKDDFEKVVRNISFLHDYIQKTGRNVATSVSCVITKKTNGIQKKVKEIFGDLVDDILFIPVRVDHLLCDPGVMHEYQIMDDSDGQINPEYICPLLFDTMYISAELTVVPCCDVYVRGGSFYDLKKDFNLENAWNCEVYKRYRDIFLKNADDSGTFCEQCLLRRKGSERFELNTDEDREKKGDENS